MTSEQSSLSKEIINTTNSARYVSVTVKRLSSPLPDGTEIALIRRIIYTRQPYSSRRRERCFPLFFYKGPEDDKERYYRLQWIDEPVSESAATKGAKPRRQRLQRKLGLFLVVAPRNERFNYSRQDDLIINAGNVSFRVIAYGVCKDRSGPEGGGCRERYYVMHGTKIKASKSDVSNSRTRIGIWHGKQFITVKCATPLPVPIIKC